MKKGNRHLFASVTATLEDLHAVAVEGQRADNSPDMEQVLLSQLRSGIVALNSTLHRMAVTVGGSHQ